jgi:serine/threonine protein kinase
MLLGRNNEVLLSGFGIALVASTSSSDQATQGIAGTTAYMAPEQLQGHPRPASDQYALGVVIYQWLSGATPFHGSSIEVASQHVLATPPPLRQKAPDLPQAVEQVVMISLAKDPKERFANVLAFAQAFEQACQSAHLPQVAMPQGVLNQPTVITPPLEQTTPVGIMLPASQATIPASMTPPGPYLPSLPPGAVPSPTDPTLRQAPMPSALLPGAPGISPHRDGPRGISRRTFVLGLVGTAAAGGALTWLVLSRQNAPSSAQVSSTPTPAPHTSATATTPANATAAPAQGALRYLYPGHTDVVNAVAWSPDGKRIASASWDHTVQVWDATNGGNPLIYRGHSAEVNAVAWSPDGKYLASGSFDQRVQIWDARTGTRLLTYSGHGDFVNTVA